MTDEKKKVKRPEGPPSKLCDVQLGTTSVREEDDDDES